MRTRFAPSPTGSLHVGNARIAVLNWLLTRQQNGRFVLRIEDTDTDRNVEGSDELILRDMRWLGLDWDEGPALEGEPPPGPHGPYRQSERGEIYAAWAERLLESSAVYPCFCSDETLEAMRAQAIAEGRAATYDGRCFALSDAERAARVASGEPFAWRFRVAPGESIIVKDAVYGDVTFEPESIGDFVVVRSDGRPTYNFAVVVDDLAMEISHVIRGSGHLSNTPRQQLLYSAFGKEPPVFAHVPTVLGPDRQKLSKRHGAKPLAGYREEGWHPDAIVNYLSLLAWSSPSGEEVLSRERLIEEISLERINAADVVFDPAKLRWLSGRHIQAMSLEDLVAAVKPFLDESTSWIAAADLAEAVGAVRTHLTTFGEINEQLAPLAAPAEIMPPADAAAVSVLRAAEEILREIPEWSREHLDAALKGISQASGARGRALYEPLRIAVTGHVHGPSFVSVLLVQGRQRVLDTLSETLSIGSIEE
jgi:glutamyl-tRNA synthetase